MTFARTSFKLPKRGFDLVSVKRGSIDRIIERDTTARKSHFCHPIAAVE
jgi:hypothetical protein